MVAASWRATVAWCARIAWKNPAENGLVLELFAGLGRGGLLVEAVMESSGRTATCFGTSWFTGGVPCPSERQAHTRRRRGLRWRSEPARREERGDHREAAPGRRIAALGAASREKRELKAAIATMDLSVSKPTPDTQFGEQPGTLLAGGDGVAELGSATLLALLARIGGPRM